MSNHDDGRQREKMAVDRKRVKFFATAVCSVVLLLLMLFFSLFAPALVRAQDIQNLVVNGTQYCKIYDYSVDDLITAAQNYRAQDPEQWQQAMQFLDQWIVNVTYAFGSAAASGGNATLEQLFRESIDAEKDSMLLQALSMRVNGTFDNGGMTGTAMTYIGPDGNATVANGTIVAGSNGTLPNDGSFVLLNMTSMIECFFLDAVDAIGGQTPVFVVDDFEALEKLGTALNLTYVNVFMSRAKYLMGVTNVFDFCNARQQQQYTAYATDSTALSWMDQAMTVGCTVLAAFRNAGVGVGPSSNGTASSWWNATTGGVNGTASGFLMDVNNGSLASSDGSGLQSVASIVDWIAWWMSTAASSSSSLAGSNSKLMSDLGTVKSTVSESAGAFDRIAKELLEEEQLRDAIDGGGERQQQPQYQPSERAQLLVRDMKESIERLGRMPLIQRVIPAAWRVMTHPATYELVDRRISRIYRQRSADAELMKESFQRMMQYITGPPSSPKKQEPHKNFGSIREQMFNIVGELQFQMESKEIVHKVSHALRRYGKNLAQIMDDNGGSDIDAWGDRDVGDSYYSSHVYHMFHNRRLAARSSSPSAGGYFTPKTFAAPNGGGKRLRRSLLYFFEVADRPPFEGYAPWQNNVFDPLRLSDWGTWLYKTLIEWPFINTESTKAVCDFPFPQLPSSEYGCKAMELAPPPKISVAAGFDPENPNCDAYGTTRAWLRAAWNCATYSWLQSVRSARPWMNGTVDYVQAECPPSFAYCAPLKAAPVVRLLLLVLPVWYAIKLAVKLWQENRREAKQERALNVAKEGRSIARAAMAEAKALESAVKHRLLSR
jgi:hypothetical protein